MTENGKAAGRASLTHALAAALAAAATWLAAHATTPAQASQATQNDIRTELNELRKEVKDGFFSLHGRISRLEGIRREP